MEKSKCEICDHSPDFHKLDDSLNLDPTDPNTPFRCTIEGCNCPDFKGGVFSGQE